MKRSGATISDRVKAELKKWIDEYNTWDKKIRYVQSQIQKLEKEILNPTDRKGFIKVPGKVYPGVEITIYDTRKNISTQMINKVFRSSAEGIETEG
jgi:uncharacterized protein (DUF342 family)